MPDDQFILGTPTLTPHDVVRVARGGARVEADPMARDAVARSRAVVERLAEGNRAVYGLNTGLGAKCDVRVAPQEAADLQRSILMARSVNIGPALPEEQVRALMFARAAGMARGGSGVQPAVFDLLVAMLNAGVHPVVAARGSVSAADLGALAQMALPLVGLGEATWGGERLPGAEALRRAGLEPVSLSHKDGLSLCSANAATVGIGSLAWCDTTDLLDLFDLVSALSLEAFQGNVGPLDTRVNRARPYPGQIDTAASLSRLLRGSYLWEPGAPRRVQDPLSLRCVTQVHGAVRDQLSQLDLFLRYELNSAADSPLVLFEDEEALSNGNFHVPQLAIGFDALGLALAQAAVMSAQRSMKLMTPEFSGLPAFLSPQPGVSTGFATVQKTIAWLYNEVRRLANPASLDYLPVANGQEDHATMALSAVQKTAAMLEHLGYLAAIELLVAAQAVDLRGRPTLGEGTRRAFDLVRTAVPPLDADRIMSDDIEAVYGLVRSRALISKAH